MSKLLTNVKRAVRAREQAERDYRAAIDAAREQHTLQQIADAAGITRYGVHYLTRPDPRKKQKEK